MLWPRHLPRMILPGSNLLLVGGLFIAGWFAGKHGYSRNEPEYQKAAAAKLAAEAEVQARPLPDSGADSPRRGEEEKKEA